MALFSLLHEILGKGYPPAKHSSLTLCPSDTTKLLVELSDIIGGLRTCKSTSAEILLLSAIIT